MSFVFADLYVTDFRRFDYNIYLVSAHRGICRRVGVDILILEKLITIN